MDFKEWFCLKARGSFTVDPVIYPSDAQFYFGRSDIKAQLRTQINKSFIDPGVPKVVLFGAYGSGKTQALHHIDYLLANDPPRSLRHKARPIHVVLEMGSKSTHKEWHLQLMEALSRDTVTDWVEKAFGKAADWDETLKRVLVDPNLVQAVKNLRGGGELPLTAWKWLSGQKLSASELQRLNLTRSLGDVGSGDMVNALAALGRLATESSNEKLIFLMDEAESFANIRDNDAVESVHNYLRRLAEPQNSSLGFVISTFATIEDDMPPTIMRPDVRSRVGASNYMEIPPLPSVEDVKAFLEELLGELIDQDAAEARIQERGLKSTRDTYPFDADALDSLCDYASQDPIKTLPRNIIHAVNESAISAWDVDKAIIDIDIIDEVAPLVFS